MPKLYEKHCRHCLSGPFSVAVEACPQCGTKLAFDSNGGGALERVVSLPLDAGETRTPTRIENIPIEGSKTSCTRFRPTQRPPIAILTLLHDGSDDQGEEFVIREDQCMIGRSEGDILVPHDAQISKSHVLIERITQCGGYYWRLRDVGSTNGTFALVDKGVIRHGQELLLGSRRYRFEASSAAQQTSTGSADRMKTSQWQSPFAVSESTGNCATSACLVELNSNGEGDEKTLPFAGEEVLVGADRSRCSLHITGDPFLSSRHAKIRRDSGGRWTIAPVKCLNGVWVRVESIRIDRAGRFQIGEQRFLVQVP